jgi:DNA invertase Pin-like site-specific DNA recombinase
LGASIATVVLPSVSVLHPVSFAHALSIASALVSSGLKLVSLTEAWLSTADPSTLAAVSAALIAQELRKASRRGSSVVLALARRNGGGKVGRPAKPISVSPEEALRLVNEQGWRKAARNIGTSPATLRRTLGRAGLLPTPRRAA